MDETKMCSICGLKPRTRAMYYCKDCNNKRGILYYKANAERLKRNQRMRQKMIVDFVNSQKAAPCTDCGRNYPPYVMDFDHVRGKKIANLARLRNSSMEKVQEELLKCELVCSNCHRERTQKRLSLSYS